MGLIAKNKFAYFDYHILEKMEAGIVLTGPEVKAVKLGHVDLKGAYVTIKNNEAWLINCHISPYKMASAAQKNYQPSRSRKLLLKHQEIKSLIGKTKAKGLTLLPLSIYTTRRLIKLTLGLGRGKKKYDKRQIIKKRDLDRQISRALRGRL